MITAQSTKQQENTWLSIGVIAMVIVMLDKRNNALLLLLLWSLLLLIVIVIVIDHKTTQLVLGSKPNINQCVFSLCVCCMFLVGV